MIPGRPAAAVELWPVLVCAVAGAIASALFVLVDDGWGASPDSLMMHCAAGAAIFAAGAALRNRLARRT